MALPTPDDPLETRLMMAVGFLVTLPLWWLLLGLLLYLVWYLMGFALLLMWGVSLAAPVLVLMGVRPDTHTELEVEIPIDKAAEAKTALRNLGAKITHETNTSRT